MHPLNHPIIAKLCLSKSPKIWLQSTLISTLYTYLTTPSVRTIVSNQSRPPLNLAQNWPLESSRSSIPPSSLRFQELDSHISSRTAVCLISRINHGERRPLCGRPSRPPKNLWSPVTDVHGFPWWTDRTPIMVTQNAGRRLARPKRFTATFTFVEPARLMRLDLPP